MSVDILGTSWDQCRSMVQHSFTSTETRRFVTTDSPGRPTRLSLAQLLNYDSCVHLDMSYLYRIMYCRYTAYARTLCLLNLETITLFEFCHSVGKLGPRFVFSCLKWTTEKGASVLIPIHGPHPSPLSNRWSCCPSHPPAAFKSLILLPPPRTPPDPSCF